MTKIKALPFPSFLQACGKFTLQISFLTALALLALTLSSCAKQAINTHGHIMSPTRMLAIVEGETTKEGVRRLLGSPPLTSSFQEAGTNNEEWIYITETASNERLGKTETQSRNVYIIRFDAEDRVVKVTNRNQDDGRDIEFSSASTPTSGQTLGILEQALGNLGISP